MITLDFKQTLSLPQERIFEFHQDPGNLNLLLDGWPGFRLLHHDGRIDLGCEMWVEVMVARCVPLVLGFRHTLYEPPHRFGEAIIHGPFRIFEHVHQFSSTDDGTEVHDQLKVALDWPYGGVAGTRALVIPTLRKFFAFRQMALERLCQHRLR